MTESHEGQPTSATGLEGQDLEVLVVGAGQAGLAIGYFLAQQGRKFAILEAAEEPAAAWRARWDSLKLFTAVCLTSPPRPSGPRDPASDPGRHDVASPLTPEAPPLALPPLLRRRDPPVRRAQG